MNNERAFALTVTIALLIVIHRENCTGIYLPGHQAYSK